MPNPVDLTGQRWGKLLAISKAPTQVSASGKMRSPAWLCRCDCGREEVFPTRRLPYCPSNAARADAATSCTHCRSQRLCAVCSKVFESLQYRATCSDACHQVQQRANQMEHYHRQMERDPDHNKQIRAQRNQRAAVDPTYAERLRQQRSGQDARKLARIKADPDRREQYNAKARERYRAHHAEARQRINEQFRARIAAMSDADYDDWLASRREAFQRYATKVRSTPEGRDKYRQYMREFRAQQALRKLMGVGHEMIKRSEQK